MKHWMKAGIVASAMVGASLTSRDAQANGRFPGAYQLVVRGDAAVLMTSFGLVSFSDDFRTKRWTCEQAFGVDPTQTYDWGAAIFADGAIGVSSLAGIARSPDRGCSFPDTQGDTDGRMADITADRDGTNGFALERGPRDMSEPRARLLETSSRGMSWSDVGATFPAGFDPYTVDSAPSNPNRVYVSGNVVADDGMTLKALLLVSNDRGRTFTAHEIPDQSRPFIGAMHPTDPDVVYVRTLRGADDGDLLVTRDGGNTFQSIARLTGIALQFFGVTGVAVSPDGTKLAYGSVKDGLFVSENGQAAERRGDFPVMCLTWTEAGLYACSTESLCGPWAIGRSNDDGRSFTSVVQELRTVGEDIACASTTPTARICPAEWPGIKSRITECADGGAPDAGDAGEASSSLTSDGKLALETSGCSVGPDRVEAPLSLLAGASVAATLTAIGRRTLRRRRR